MTYYASVVYEATAAQTDFTITFPFITPEHVKVVQDTVALTYRTDWTLVGTSTVRLTVAADEGDVVSLRRETSPTARLVDWTAGAVITETDLDLESNQFLYLHQELLDTIEDLEVEGASAPVTSVFTRIGDIIAADDDYTISQITGLTSALEGKSATTHDHDTAYSALGHNHTGVYAELSHNHDTAYAALGHNHSGVYSAIDHNHDTAYSTITHDHDAAYSALGHDHDAAYSALGHNHDGTYVPTTLTVSGGTSLTGGGALSENRTITLLNDEASPGNDKVYGTGPTGTKGWFSKASSGSGATQLDELSDVADAVVTNRNVLVADGTDWHGRALVEADISDLGTYSLTSHDHDSAYSAIGHNHDSDYATLAHDHDSAYSALGHNHDSDYATLAHVHGNITDDGKVGTTANIPLITGTGGVIQAGSFGTLENTFAQGNHNHDAAYSALGHNHDSDYATLAHDHDSDYAALGHNHDADYSDITHDHAGVYSETDHTHTLANITDAGSLAGKSTVAEGDITDGAVTEAKLGNGSVTEGKLGSASVTETKLGTGAVTADKIGTGAVTETKVGTGAITADKLGTSAVTETKIDTGAVVEAKLGAGSVTAAKLADKAHAAREFLVASVSSTYTLTTQADHDITLTAATDFTLPTPTNNSTAIVCFARIIDGGFSVTWADTITWAGGSAPAFSTKTWAWLTFRIVKNSSGTVTYFGAINGYDS